MRVVPRKRTAARGSSVRYSMAGARPTPGRRVPIAPGSRGIILDGLSVTPAAPGDTVRAGVLRPGFGLCGGAVLLARADSAFESCERVRDAAPVLVAQLRGGEAGLDDGHDR